MGTPEFAVPCLEHLIINQYQVVAVYTQPDKHGGRGRSVVSSPLKRAAVEWELPVVQPLNLKEPGSVAQLASLHPDVVVTAAFGQILPKSVLEIPSCGCINIHPSLLPKYRGASPVVEAILNGDEFAGVSIMLMDEGLDTGPVLTRAQVAISSRDTTGSLTDKLFQAGARMLLDILVRWSRGVLTPRPQNESEATYSSTISKQDGAIDWHLPAVNLWRRVRAFQPWPGCHTKWQGRLLEIIEAMPLPLTGEGSLEVGRVVAVAPESKAAIGVVTGDGVLGVSQVQLEGKRVMSAAEFVRGQRQFIGSQLL